MEKLLIFGYQWTFFFFYSNAQALKRLLFSRFSMGVFLMSLVHDQMFEA
jgi:hypothetical protein